MMIEMLRESVRCIPGVASAEVSPGPDEEPLVRVWTDGTRPDADVQSAVELAVAMTESDIEPSDQVGLHRVPDKIMPDAAPNGHQYPSILPSRSHHRPVESRDSLSRSPAIASRCGQSTTPGAQVRR
jgi:hypothetical protein